MARPFLYLLLAPLAWSTVPVGCVAAPDGPSVQAEVVLSETVPTVATAVVEAPGAEGVVIEFEADSAAPRTVVASPGEHGTFEATLVGFKPHTEVRVVAVATVDGAECESAEMTFTTGSMPSLLPPTTVWRDEQTGVASGGYFITSLVPEGPPVILDGDGDYVWWRDPHANTPYTLSPVQPARDGSGLLYLVWSGGHVEGAMDDDRQLVKVRWDGSIEQVLEAPDAHHDFTELPDGSIAMIVYDVREFDGVELAGDRLVERTFDGDEVTVWSIWDHIPYDAEIVLPDDYSWGHCNAVKYDPDQDVYYVSSHDFDVLFKIDRATGDVLWTLGRDQGGYTLTDGQTWFTNQHRFQLLDDRTLLLFDNGTEAQAASRVIELEIDEQLSQLDIGWSYQPDPPLAVFSFGDVRRLASGNTLIDWSTSGQLDEVTAAGDPVWRLNLPLGYGFGFFTWREQLGPAD